MLKPASLTLFSASAGSGKTHNLVKIFLGVCLKTDAPRAFADILAITFTRKATAEMKERIVRTLSVWVDNAEGQGESIMREELMDELGIDRDTFDSRAKKVLSAILHHYGYFSLTTIDAFTYRLVRQFSKDLHLPAGFEVELDLELLLAEATDRLLTAYGEDALLSKFLLQHARFLNQEKERGWHIRREVLETAKAFFNHAEQHQLQAFSSLSLDVFNDILKALRERKQAKSTRLVEIGKEGSGIIASFGLSTTDFLRGGIPKYFDKLTTDEPKTASPTVWKQVIPDEANERKPATKKDAKPSVVMAVQQAIEQLEPLMLEAEETFSLLKMIAHVQQHLYGMAVLGRLSAHLRNICEERQIVPLAELYDLISRELSQQSSAYLFERLGERYRYLFIDEFQDTSIQQWQNLRPFADDIRSQTGALLLVGDAKQAIYRWRGGDVDQFLELYQNGRVEKEGFVLEELAHNYRSREEVVRFNNDFFQFRGSQFPEEEEGIRQLYEHAAQIPVKKGGGRVEIRRSEATKVEEFHLWQDPELIALVQKMLELGYEGSDIVILSRNNTTGDRLIPLLQEAGIAVSSERGQSLSGAAEVLFLIDMTRLCMQPKEVEHMRSVLRFLLGKEQISAQKAPEIGKMFNDHGPWEALKKNYPELGSPNLKLGMFELLQHWIRVFQLQGQADPYLIQLLDQCRPENGGAGTSAADLIQWWEDRGNDMTVEMNERRDAVKLMTIHKSKGLQFPVVIVADADWPTSNLSDAFLWSEVNPEDFGGLERFPFEGNKRNWSDALEPLRSLYKKASLQSDLDNLNLLYVAFTRAVDRLYVFSQWPEKAKQDISWWITQYLDSRSFTDAVYSVGDDETAIKKKEETPKGEYEIQLRSQAWEEDIHIALQAELKEEQEIGLSFHDLAAHCHSREDWEKAAQLHVKLRPSIEKVLAKMELPEYAPFFGTHPALNERSLTDANGRMHRPDRVVFEGSGIVHILDYKTGSERPEHHEQLQKYRDVFEEAGFTVGQIGLLYI